MRRRNFLAALAAPAVACLIKFDKEIRILENADACGTTLTVGHPIYFEPGDVLHVPRTGEHMMVTARGASSLTVVRGFGNSKIQPVIDDDAVWILGRAKVGERKVWVNNDQWHVTGGYSKWVEEELLPTIDLVKKGD